MSQQINDMTHKMDFMFCSTEEAYHQQFHSLLYMDFQIDADSFQYIHSTDLIKIMSNLIDNSFDSTVHLEQKKRKVIVSLKKTSNTYQFMVSNSCEFISPEQLDNFFQMGYSTKHEKMRKGRGYGLAIVKTITEKYKGEIQVESNHNWTHFEIVIPIVEEK